MELEDVLKRELSDAEILTVIGVLNTTVHSYSDGEEAAAVLYSIGNNETRAGQPNRAMLTYLSAIAAAPSPRHFISISATKNAGTNARSLGRWSLALSLYQMGYKNSGRPEFLRLIEKARTHSRDGADVYERSANDYYERNINDYYGTPNEVACFASGTPILLPCGRTTPIECILPGMMVATRSNAGILSSGRVYRVKHHNKRPVVGIKTTGERPVWVTTNHLIAVPGGFARAGKLRHGARVISYCQDGFAAREIVDPVKATKKHFVHNLYVDGDFNYIAGSLVGCSFAVAPKLRKFLRNISNAPFGHLPTSQRPSHISAY